MLELEGWCRREGWRCRRGSCITPKDAAERGAWVVAGTTGNITRGGSENEQDNYQMHRHKGTIT